MGWCYKSYPYFIFDPPDPMAYLHRAPSTYFTRIAALCVVVSFLSPQRARRTLYVPKRTFKTTTTFCAQRRAAPCDLLDRRNRAGCRFRENRPPVIVKIISIDELWRLA